MPAMFSRRYAGLAGAAAVALLVVGCGGESGSSTAASTPSPSSTAPTTAAATTSTVGPMTGEELVWLEGIGKLHTKTDKVLTDAPSNMTSSALGTLATKDARLQSRVGSTRSTH
jgi:hypothetical protein